MKSKFFSGKNKLMTLCVFVVFLAISLGVFKLFQSMSCKINYTIFNQLDHDNKAFIRFPDAEKVQFVITGKNLSFIDTISFEISSNNKSLKLISNSFERIGDNIILMPAIVSADQYLLDSFKLAEKNTLPVSLFRQNGSKYILKLSYKGNNNTKIKAALLMTGRIKLYNYSINFNPLDTTDIKSHIKSKRETSTGINLILKNGDGI